MNVTIIGSGNMARGIGTRVVAGHHSLTILDRSIQKARDLALELGKSVGSDELGKKVDSEITILALPYLAIFEVIEKYKDQLPGKIVVDISNPIDFDTFALIPPPGSSGAQEIAKNLPTDTRLVKAFNTTFAGTLVAGRIDGKQLDVFIAGDDEDAKKAISKLAEDGGLRPLDSGPLSSAHYLEAIQLVHMSLQKDLGNTWMSTVKILQ